MTASEQITEYIAGLKDWRAEVLSRVRELVLEVAPGAVEEWKWKAPVWSEHGLLVSASGFKSHVGVNFFHGAELPDPTGLLAASDSKEMRSIKLVRGAPLDEMAFRDLVRAAVAFNVGR